MIVRKDERPIAVREAMRGGGGSVFFRHLMPVGALPGKLRLLSELILKKGDAVGTHGHEGEVEIFYILSGTATVLDAGEEKLVYAGDVAVTDGNAPHALENRHDEDLKVLAIIVLDD